MVDEESFMATLTGDRNGVIKVEERSNKGGISSWFMGSSAPVAVGIGNSSEDDDDDSERKRLGMHSSTSNASVATRLQAANNTTSTNSGASTTSRFSFFTSSSAAPKANQPKPTLPALKTPTDSLLTLSIPSALYPHGVPTPADTFSPSAYKNLQTTSLTLLTKLHTAYKTLHQSNQEIIAENSALSEELEEADTRAECLRSQLAEMAGRVAEQEGVIEALEREKERERVGREKSIALIKSSREAVEGLDVEGEEDLGIQFAERERERVRERERERRKEWRSSRGSEISSLSASSTSDNEGVESVFSHSISPSLSPSLRSQVGSFKSFDQVDGEGEGGAEGEGEVDTEETPELMQAEFGRVVGHPGAHSSSASRPGPVQAVISSPSPASKQKPGPKKLQRSPPQAQVQILPQTQTQTRPNLPPRGSTFQKLLHGITPPAPSPNPAPSSKADTESCTNCQGRDSSVAWDTVGLLRVENRGLKERVGELEGAVEGALRLCGGF